MSSFSVTFRDLPADASPGAADAVRVLDLVGELDAHTATELEAAFQKCLDDGRVRLVANGERLQYISSAGLGVFMAYVEQVRQGGGDIKIAALQERVYDVFDLLGFGTLFDLEETEAAAAARFADRPTGPTFD